MNGDTASLIRRSRSGDRDAAACLVQENAGLIWSVAKRFFGRGVDPEDLYQLGCLGFLKAVAKFDLDYGTQFSTYAVPKISGEIRRFLRDDGTVKVSRGLKERAASVRAARQTMIGTLGREPTVSELAETLHLLPEDIAEAEGATGFAESIQKQTGEEGFSLEDVLSDTQTEERLVEHIALHEAIARLEERQRTVILLRYFHGLTQERIAGLIGVSQVQVSRIEKKALHELRNYL